MERIAYFNGKIGNYDEMMIPFSDRSVFYGDAIYDAVLVLDRKPFALELHLDRLYKSCAMTDITFAMSRQTLKEEIDRLLTFAPMGSTMLYLQVTRGAAPRKHEYSADIKANIEAQAAILAASTLTEIDLTQYADMPKQVDKAYKTSGGNYVIETHGSGFGINGDHYYNPSGEYIYVKVALTADGKVINCVTIAQSETDGIGSVCADKEFYSQFNGKDETNYKEIDAISGATLTTNGYKSAVSKAFEAVKIMEGVA